MTLPPASPVHRWVRRRWAKATAKVLAQGDRVLLPDQAGVWYVTLKRKDGGVQLRRETFRQAYLRLGGEEE